MLPEGHGTARIPANNAEGHVPVKCCYAPDIPNFIAVSQLVQVLARQEQQQLHAGVQRR